MAVQEKLWKLNISNMAHITDALPKEIHMLYSIPEDLSYFVSVAHTIVDNNTDFI